jgi:hypothetical protein
MPWIFASLFFCWLIWRELRRPTKVEKGFDRPEDGTPVFVPYVAILAVLAVLALWPPLRLWNFERFLTAKANLLTENGLAKVHCNTIFDTFFDSNNGAGAHANFDTGGIVFQYPHCQRLMDYLAHPAKANGPEIFALGLFTHESMHVRGEHNENRTECQAVQRMARAGQLLGLPEATARQSARDYYRNFYLRRAEAMSTAYFTAECAPGKSMDEHLPDAAWR